MCYHYSQPSRETVTQSSGTSLLVYSNYEVAPPCRKFTAIIIPPPQPQGNETEKNASSKV